MGNNMANVFCTSATAFFDPAATFAKIFKTSNLVSLSDLTLFFSFNNNVTNRCNVASSRNLSGVFRDIDTKAVKSTGRDNKAASSCHLAVRFTFFLDML
jgi:hypothetical protein